MELYQYGKRSDKEIQEECKRIFISEYIRNDDGSEIVIKTVDGIRVIFTGDQFDHAFSREDRYTKTRYFDYSRARRIKWIKSVIKESCSGLRVLKRDITKTDVKQREYYLPDKKYLVVLDWEYGSKPHYLKFNTAYSVTMAWKLSQIEKDFGIQ